MKVFSQILRQKVQFRHLNRIMAKLLYQPNRFQLPARAGTKTSASIELPTRLALINRIANLKEIETVESSSNNVVSQMDVYLGPDLSASLRERQAPQLLCSLNCNSMTINGLDLSTRQQILDQHWGEQVSDSLAIHMPRDNEELDIVWNLLLQAYNFLSNSSVKEPMARMVPNWNLPRFSRTSLQ
jgi:hypothetical protein